MKTYNRTKTLAAFALKLLTAMGAPLRRRYKRTQITPAIMRITLGSLIAIVAVGCGSGGESPATSPATDSTISASLPTDMGNTPTSPPISDPDPGFEPDPGPGSDPDPQRPPDPEPVPPRPVIDTPSDNVIVDNDTIELVGQIPGFFEVTASGSASYQLTLQFSPGPAGISLPFTINLDSQSKHKGVFGNAMPSSPIYAQVARCNKTVSAHGVSSGIGLDHNDAWCMGPDVLRRVPDADAAACMAYAPEFTTPDGVTLVLACGTFDLHVANAPAYFMVYNKDGTSLVLGNDPSGPSTGAIVEAGGVPLIYATTKIIADRFGNYFTAYWDQTQQGEQSLRRFTSYNADGIAVWTAHLTYSQHPQPQLFFLLGNETRLTKLVDSITVTARGSAAMRRYFLDYEQNSLSRLPELTGIQACFSEPRSRYTCWPKTTFGYHDPGSLGFDPTGERWLLTNFPTEDLLDLTLADITGDAQLDGFFNVSHCSGSCAGWGDRVYTHEWFYMARELAQYSPGISTSFIHDRGDYAIEHRIVADWNLDGLDDLILPEVGADGRYMALTSRRSDSGFTFEPVILFPHRDSYRSQVLGFGDLNGDGRPDYADVEDGELRVNINRGVEGFAQEAEVWYTGVPGDARPQFASLNADSNQDVVWSIRQDGNHVLGSLVSNGDRFLDYSHKVLSPLPADGRTMPLKIGDANADGLADIYSFTENSFVLHLSTGRGFVQAPNEVPALGDDLGLSLDTADLNRDGRDDLLVEKDGRLLYLRGSHEGLAPPIDLGGFMHRMDNESFGDATGNSIVDLFRVAPRSCGASCSFDLEIRMHPGLAGHSGELSYIQEGLGYRIDIQKSAINDLANPGVHDRGNSSLSYPLVPVKGPMRVVSSTTFSHRGIKPKTKTYEYEGFATSTDGRGFVGAARIFAYAQQTGVSVVTDFSHQAPYAKKPVRVRRYVVHGSQATTLDCNPHEEACRAAHGLAIEAVHKVLNTWDTLSLGDGNDQRHIIYLKKQKERSFDGPIFQEIVTTTEINEHGDATSITVASSNGSGQDRHVQTTRNEFLPLDSRYCFGRLSSSVGSSSQPAPTNGNRAGTDIDKYAAFEYDQGTCALAAITENPGTDQEVRRALVRDRFGNILRDDEHGPGIAAGATEYSYDPTGRYEVSETNAAGHTTSQVVEPFFGKPVSVTDQKGLTTYFQLGIDGQLEVKDLPRPERYKVYRRILCGATVCTEDSSFVEHTASWVDGLAKVTEVERDDRGRERATRRYDPLSGYWTQVSTDYDKAGNAFITSAPHYRNTDRSRAELFAFIHSSFDPLSRPTLISQAKDESEIPLLPRVIQPGQPPSSHSANMEFEYDGLQTTIRYPNGSITREQRDVVGNVAQRCEGTEDVLACTEYGYDALNRLTYERDPEGNETHITYDHASSPSVTADPNRGVTRAESNGLGQTLRKVNGNGEVIEFIRDVLGRELQVDYFANDDQLVRSCWRRYDSGVGNAIGDITVAECSDGVAMRFERDPVFGELTSVCLAVDGENLCRQIVLSNAGQIAETIEPAMITGQPPIQLAYDRFSDGDIRAIRIGTADQHELIYQVQAKDAAGNLTRELYGNGVVVDSTYDRATGAPLSRSANSPAIGNFVDQSWGWLLGNLSDRLSIIDGVEVAEEFFYDSLNQIASSERRINGTVVHSEPMRYSLGGNILQKGESQFLYEGPQPDAVTNVLTPDGEQQTLVYDPVGRLTRGLNGLRLEWMPNGKPGRIQNDHAEAIFRYGTSDERVQQIKRTARGEERIVYFGNLERHTDQNGVVSAQYRITVGDQIVALIDQDITGTRTSYVVTDHLGSISAITDADGVVVDRRLHDTWGKVIDPATYLTPSAGDTVSLALTTRGHTAHEQLDDFNLIHANQRLYFPDIARFISPDPRNDPGQRLLNAYSYVGSNPLSARDPSGEVLSVVVPFLVSIVADVVTLDLLVKAAFIGGLADGFIATGDVTGAIRQGIFSAASFGSTYGIGVGLSGGQAALAHGAVNAGLAYLGEGDVVASFGAAFFSYSATHKFLKYGEGGVRGNISRALVAGSIAGTASVIGGGKFGNGAVTGALISLFNGDKPQLKAKLKLVGGIHYHSDGEASIEGDVIGIRSDGEIKIGRFRLKGNEDLVLEAARYVADSLPISVGVSKDGVSFSLSLVPLLPKKLAARIVPTITWTRTPEEIIGPRLRRTAQQYKTGSRNRFPPAAE